MSARSSSLLLATGLALVATTMLACPAKAPTPQSQARESAGPAKIAGEDDPRVVRDTHDLYAVDDAPNPPREEPAPGSGRPDTSNGVCKLFAPKLPEPECCPFETGFDADRIKQLCGHALYMGESLQQSCGYYFLPDMAGSLPVSMRGSKVAKAEVRAAVANHDLRIQHHFKDPDFESTPIPGVEGGMWSEKDGVHWAFLPGWSSVRLISWAEEACPIEVMPEVLKLIAEAKEPPENAPRPGLEPVARE